MNFVLMKKQICEVIGNIDNGRPMSAPYELRINKKVLKNGRKK